MVLAEQTHRPTDLCGITRVEEKQWPRECHGVEWIDPRARRDQHPAFGVSDGKGDYDTRVEMKAARVGGRGEARERCGVCDFLRDPRLALALESCQCPAGHPLMETCLNELEQTGLSNRVDGSDHTEILRLRGQAREQREREEEMKRAIGQSLRFARAIRTAHRHDR